MVRPTRLFHSNRGFSLIELLCVIVIFGILLSIGYSSYKFYWERIGIWFKGLMGTIDLNNEYHVYPDDESENQICNENCIAAEHDYYSFLRSRNLTHSPVLFDEFIILHGKQICPNHGNVIFAEGKIWCSIHKPNEDSDEDDEVPFL